MLKLFFIFPEKGFCTFAGGRRWQIYLQDDSCAKVILRQQKHSVIVRLRTCGQWMGFGQHFIQILPNFDKQEPYTKPLLYLVESIEKHIHLHSCSSCFFRTQTKNLRGRRIDFSALFNYTTASYVGQSSGRRTTADTSGLCRWGPGQDVPILLSRGVMDVRETMIPLTCSVHSSN